MYIYLLWFEFISLIRVFMRFFLGTASGGPLTRLGGAPPYCCVSREEVRTAGRCLLGRPPLLVVLVLVAFCGGSLWSVGVGELVALRGLVPTYLPDSVVARAKVVLEEDWLSSEDLLLLDVPLFLLLLRLLRVRGMPELSLLAAVSFSTEAGS